MVHVASRCAYGPAATTAAPAFTPYRSFVRTEMQGDREAIVFEKFHLFWKHGLRFLLAARG